MFQSALTCLILLGGAAAACAQEFRVVAKNGGPIPGDPGAVFTYIDGSHPEGRAGFFGDHQVYFYAGRRWYGPSSLYNWSSTEGIGEVLRGDIDGGLLVPRQPVICNSGGDVAVYVYPGGGPSTEARIYHADGSVETLS